MNGQGLVERACGILDDSGGDGNVVVLTKLHIERSHVAVYILREEFDTVGSFLDEAPSIDGYGFADRHTCHETTFHDLDVGGRFHHGYVAGELEYDSVHRSDGSAVGGSNGGSGQNTGQRANCDALNALFQYVSFL